MFKDTTKDVLDQLNLVEVADDVVEAEIEKNDGILEKVYNFINMVSLRHYISLNTFDLNDSVSFFETLLKKGFIIKENPLMFSEIDINNFHSLLKDVGVDPNNIGYDLLMKQLKGELDELWNKELEGHDNLLFSETLSMFTIQGDGLNTAMNIGDMPNLNLLFTIQKALVAKCVAEYNVSLLETGNNKVYEVLPALK